jgi:hypothetical protein
MFVRYFVEIDLPFERAERALLSSPHIWLPGIARAAEHRGTMLLSEVGFGSPGYRVSKLVQIELAPPVRFPSKTELPMSWRAAGPERLFPTLDADLEVAPLGPARIQLSISARYRPPLGAVGRTMDRVLFHRIAEATVKDFVDRAGAAIERLAAAEEASIAARKALVE